MSSILDDVLIGAEWIAQALHESGYHADFSPESLWQIEFFFEDHIRNEKPVSGGLLSEDMGARLLSLGAYVGEVLRRNIGGEWLGDDSDPEAEINIMLKLASGAQCWPVQRVISRVKNGSKDSIAAYGIGMGLDIGPRPSRKPLTSIPKKKRPTCMIILLALVFFMLCDVSIIAVMALFPQLWMR